MDRARVAALGFVALFGLMLLTASVSRAETLAVAKGTIKSVDSEKGTFVLTTAGGKDVTVKVNDSTKYTLNGEASTANAVLKAGAKVKVTHEEGVAAKVDAES